MREPGCDRRRRRFRRASQTLIESRLTFAPIRVEARLVKRFWLAARGDELRADRVEARGLRDWPAVDSQVTQNPEPSIESASDVNWSSEL